MATALRYVPSDARSRPVLTGRPLICQLGGDDQATTTEALRIQRLRLLGVIGQRAKLLSDLAWEAHRG